MQLSLCRWNSLIEGCFLTGSECSSSLNGNLFDIRIRGIGRIREKQSTFGLSNVLVDDQQWPNVCTKWPVTVSYIASPSWWKLQTDRLPEIMVDSKRAGRVEKAGVRHGCCRGGELTAVIAADRQSIQTPLNDESLPEQW